MKIKDIIISLSYMNRILPFFWWDLSSLIFVDSGIIYTKVIKYKLLKIFFLVISLNEPPYLYFLDVYSLVKEMIRKTEVYLLILINDINLFCICKWLPQLFCVGITEYHKIHIWQSNHQWMNTFWQKWKNRTTSLCQVGILMTLIWTIAIKHFWSIFIEKQIIRKMYFNILWLYQYKHESGECTFHQFKYFWDDSWKFDNSTAKMSFWYNIA